MTMHLTYEIVHKFRGQGKMNEAEDWMRNNIKGQWELQFLGMSEEMDDFKKTKSYIFHVRFNFGRSDDMKRFKEEYIQGKRPAPKAKAPAQKKTRAAKLAVGRLVVRGRRGRRQDSGGSGSAGPWRGGAVSTDLGFLAIWQDRRPRGPER
jgi:hypothetical protein